RKWKRAADLAPAAAKQLPVEVVEPLSDDLATYSAFQVLTQLAGEAVDFNGGGNAAAAGNDAAASLKAALLFLGFDVAPAKVDEDAIAKSITKRLTLIAAGNWAEADRIRAELLAQGIQLKDGKDPVTSARITTWEVKR
ncbi:MAG: cysteine--tRNA ligase, partial [Mesorhizobium sp.]